jgi:tetratricopeptide (TPR) repeat protein
LAAKIVKSNFCEPKTGQNLLFIHAPFILAVMSEQRLKTLIKFYEEDPNDPFNLYGLALEYQKSDLVKSDVLFTKLLTEFPQYVPSYYQAAKLKVELKQAEAALAIYQKGIEVSKLHNEKKAEQELRSAYNELMFELE